MRTGIYAELEGEKLGYWPGKYVIGLTGSIGTGKSVVRHMLEQMGAFGIDADTLAHRVYSRGTRGNELIRQTFGDRVITGDGEVDRFALARMVFQDRQMLSGLERIVHPLVIDLVNGLIVRAPQKVIVIEAIKLLETELASHCDAIWVVATSPEVQLQRLMQERHMSAEAARARIDAQLSQEERIKHATVVVANDGSFADTWKQVSTTWENSIPAKYRTDLTPTYPVTLSTGAGEVSSAQLTDAPAMASFLSSISDAMTIEPGELFVRNFCLVLRIDKKIRALLIWNAENLVAGGLNYRAESAVPLAETLAALVTCMETEARRKLCEVALFPDADNKGFIPEVLAELEYEQVLVTELERLAWREQVQKNEAFSEKLFFKALS